MYVCVCAGACVCVWQYVQYVCSLCDNRSIKFKLCKSRLRQILYYFLDNDLFNKLYRGDKRTILLYIYKPYRLKT